MPAHDAPLSPRASDLLDDPIAQFQRWFDDVLRLGLAEPNAVVLATASAAAAPSARVVLLKGVDAAGFLFFTNRDSRKGRELAENPRASLCFHWRELARQVRVEGVVRKASARVSDAYFRSRPRASQIAAWASPQSQPIIDRAALLARKAEMETRFAGRDVPRPKHWGGLVLKPHVIEFWRHGDDRLHDRVVYVRARRAWSQRRLGP